METTLNPKPYSTLGLYEDTGNENGKPTLMSGVFNCEPRVLGLGFGVEGASMRARRRTGWVSFSFQKVIMDRSKSRNICRTESFQKSTAPEFQRFLL